MLTWGDTPGRASPERSWPTYSVVGGEGGRSKRRQPDILFDNANDLRREDDEIILILSAILKDL